MVWVDLTSLGIDGWQAQFTLEAMRISINRQTVPYDLKSAYYPSGIRLGTPALTTRGMKAKEVAKIATWMIEALRVAQQMGFAKIGSPDKKEDQLARKKFKVAIKLKPEIKKLGQAVKSLCLKFPIP